MSFLDATRAVREFAGGPALPFLFGLSGTPDPFLLYLRAAGARRGRDAQVRTLPFNTLGQALLGSPGGGDPEVFLILPWDLAPETDWRSGVPGGAPDAVDIRARADETIERLAARGATLLYLPAPTPPLWLDSDQNRNFSSWLELKMRSSGAHVLGAASFSLASYLTSGCPVHGAGLEEVADLVVEKLLPGPVDSAKVLVTDLDNTLWSGIVGDDGPEAIEGGPEGKGYPHFIYQSLLKRLAAEGVLLAAVTKNDPDPARAPFRLGKIHLREEDFVAIVASWNAKSAQIRELATQLNLGLDSFVFVDDNPVELAEVGQALPEVHCLRFPSALGGLPELLDELTARFRRSVVSEEDRQRTELYRRRLEGLVPSGVDGADLTRFLAQLDMTLTFHDRSVGDRGRAVQLINKTNQFNLNGLRLSDDEVRALLEAGGRLVTASLSDRTGDHGEILSCLVGPDGDIRSLVMSCRVFQRKVEHTFLHWLTAQADAPTSLAFRETEKNEPLRRFLRELCGGEVQDGSLPIEPDEVSARWRDAADLFRIEDRTRPTVPSASSGGSPG